MIKQIFILLFTLIQISGCMTDCITGEDNKINISVVENRETLENMGFSYNHNITLHITNIGDSPARSVNVETYYCNELRVGQRTCENRTFNIGDMAPKTTISKYFEYDRVLVQNQLDGTYQLHYKVSSCLPITTVNNTIFIKQR